jgi:hypothetical protein
MKIDNIELSNNQLIIIAVILLVLIIITVLITLAINRCNCANYEKYNNKFKTID